MHRHCNPKRNTEQTVRRWRCMPAMQLVVLQRSDSYGGGFPYMKGVLWVMACIERLATFGIIATTGTKNNTRSVWRTATLCGIA